MKKILYFSLMLGLMGCQQKSPPAFDAAAAQKEIEALNAQFSEKFVKGDSSGVAALYAKDAKFMDAGAPAVVGRAAIQHTMTGFIQAGITKVDFKTTGIWGCDSLLAEEGELQLFIKTQKIAQDKYIVLWKKENGEWKIFRDISNSDLPAKQ